MKPCVFITGASGFVGSHIVQRFVDSGFHVCCGLRNTSNGRWIEQLDVEKRSIELSDPRGFQEALRDVDIVVHAAGVTSARTSVTFRVVNTDGTVRLAEAALRAGVRRFVYISSLAARGPDSALAAGQNRPISAYGFSKLKAENGLRNLVADLEVVVLRPVTVYGPRDRELLPLFKMAKAGFILIPWGKRTVQLVNVSDLAAVTVAAATAPAQFGPFPVAEEATYSWPEVARVFGEALGRTVRPLSVPAGMLTGAGWLSETAARLRGVEPEFDVRRARAIARHSWTCIPHQAEEEFGWRASVPFAEGTVRTAAWYREHGWL